MNKFTVGAALLLLTPLASAQEVPPTPAPAEQAARATFSARMTALATKGDWHSIITEGRAWQGSHPADSNGWWSAGDGAYNLGDIDAAIRDYSKADAMDGGSAPYDHFINARRIRAQYPHLQLKPLQFVTGDVMKHQAVWHDKGAALLKAKRYDDIEHTARDLQKSGATNAEGMPSLRYFFEGLCGKHDGTPTPQSALAAWKVARPNSNLARIVAIQCWTDAAWRIRGDGYANTITPEMSQDMNDALAHAFADIKALPATAYDSPLAFDVCQGWAQLSGLPRESLDALFKEGAAKFPNYLPLYRSRGILLMTRWFGAPGELEAFVTHRADALGGTKGDIFYARMIWTQVGYYGDIWKETAFSYDRFKRGITALCKAQPDSVWAANTLMNFAQRHNDDAPVKAFFASPRGYLIDKQWWTEKGKVRLPELRMQYLAQ